MSQEQEAYRNSGAGIKHLLDRPIAFHRIFSVISGGVTSGLFLSQAVYWSARATHRDGWFYKTQKEWEEETTLSRYEQQTARDKLKRLNIIEERRAGIPAKLYYKVNYGVIESLANKYAGIPHTGMGESSIQEGGNPANYPIDYSETTTEINTPPTPPQSKNKNPDPSEDAQTVLTYLNERSGHSFRSSRHIQKLLDNTDATVDDCKLVIDWLKEYRCVTEPDWCEKYFDNATPFRYENCDNFDKFRAKAEAWRRDGSVAKDAIKEAIYG